MIIIFIMEKNKLIVLNNDFCITSIVGDLLYRGKSAVIKLYSNVLKDKFSLLKN